ncbi:helix-turn-helix domain-containing protein [Escherichia coli]|nr:helix-turn-helix domain-containing protein [Escherichia coli]EFH5466895.1 helix-turn-helix domain-containing protein [Escherichia coli]ELJ3841387.1 helix-turn-helix domain-containing protein [Escherichia coli]ELJ3843942.1 helix-turn-helix domain-containing protein [Escherichia coli]
MSKIKLIREKYQYVDQQTGEIKDRTLNIPHYFCEIEFIYSSNIEDGKAKFSAEMQKLYCYVSDWEKSGGICFETQTKLSKVCGCSRKTVNELIGLMIKIGLLEEVGERIPKRPLKLRALPLTDAHITPPRESSLPDPSEKENESNEILNVSEIIVEEEIQESEFPEKIFNWLLSLDKKKPPHEETEDFVKRALDSKNIYLEKQAFHDLIISLREKSEIYDSIPF